MSHDIFISYSRRDTERMQAVRDGLREAGLTVWTDEGIEPGTESWKKALSDAITGCTTVVVLFSPDAAQSTWVNRELDFAELKEKNLYPLLVRGEPKDALPFGYTTYQFIDIRSDDSLASGLSRLVKSLSEHLPVEPNHAVQKIDLETQKSSSEFHPIETKKVEELSWKWVETDYIRLFIPSTFKIEEASNENWARNLLIMYADKDKGYQMLLDESEWAKLSGIPGTKAMRDKVLSDMTGLTPVTSFISKIILPVFVTGASLIFPVFNIIIYQAKKRITVYFKKIAGMVTVSDWHYIPTRGGLLLKGTLESDTHKAYVYMFHPIMTNVAIWLQFVGEIERLERDGDIYDRLAQSVHLIPEKD